MGSSKGQTVLQEETHTFLKNFLRFFPLWRLSRTHTTYQCTLYEKRKHRQLQIKFRSFPNLSQSSLVLSHSSPNNMGRKLHFLVKCNIFFIPFRPPEQNVSFLLIKQMTDLAKNLRLWDRPFTSLRLTGTVFVGYWSCKQIALVYNF